MKNKNNLFDKLTFFNKKTGLIAGLLTLVWIVTLYFFIWEKFDDLEIVKNGQEATIIRVSVANAGNLIIVLVVGICGKLIYKHKKVKCSRCSYISGADRKYCGNCGEKLSDDVLD